MIFLAEGWLKQVSELKQVSDFGFKISNFGFQISDFRFFDSSCLIPKFKIRNSKSRQRRGNAAPLRVQYGFADDFFDRSGAIVHECDAAVSQQSHPFLFCFVSEFVGGTVLNDHRTQFVIHNH